MNHKKVDRGDPMPINKDALIQGHGGLVVNASDSGSRGRGFEPHSGQTVLCR